MLALIFMSKLPWKIIRAFCLPLNFAIGSFYNAHRVISGKTDCRSFKSLAVNCADTNTLFWYDFFGFSGFFLSYNCTCLTVYRFFSDQKRFGNRCFE